MVQLATEESLKMQGMRGMQAAQQGVHAKQPVAQVDADGPPMNAGQAGVFDALTEEKLAKVSRYDFQQKMMVDDSCVMGTSFLPPPPTPLCVCVLLRADR